MEQLRRYDVKHLGISDITPGLLKDFAHYHIITKKWVKREDGWELTDASILREWSDKKKIWITEYMCQQIEHGGITVGAFYNKRLIGFCCVDGTVSGSSAKYANLTMLFVDDNWKRYGVGKLLFQEACRHAIKLGADELFISATPSAEAVAFYHKMGCVDAKEIVGVFVDSEDDRYLELTVLPASAKVR